MASEFAAPFDGDRLGHFLGLWHDVGKFNPAFQEYLRLCEVAPISQRPKRGPDHKAAGTQIAIDQQLGLAALLVQGHHGGMTSPTAMKDWLAERKSDPANVIAASIAAAQEWLPELLPNETLLFPEHVRDDARQAEFFLRMLFSALVDADFLDTEAHFSPEKTVLRGSSISFGALWERFEADRARFAGQDLTPVNIARQEIYQACLDAAEEAQGFYRLTVPTGGGKTLSAMAFALRHALRHGLSRIIVAVPFISITEQTAEVYRRIFGVESDTHPVVLEHHSGVNAGGEALEEDFRPERVRLRLAAENWDAPIIVTTTVQLFESLFACSTSKTRKLHRLAQSIIILDEAQALPPSFLQPILDGLKDLCAHYRTTVVVSTATQPAFNAIPLFRDVPAREIVPTPERWFRELRRVRYEWPPEPLSWEEVAAFVRLEQQALAIVNTKRDAIALLDALDDPDALHLSTLLCGAHRRDVIKDVRQRLASGSPCRLVSTQVIEAGVDLDFPVVARAMGPLDSIVQAAGRCNREGRLEHEGNPVLGRVVVFRALEGGIPKGAYKTGAGIAGAIVGAHGVDLHEPAIYFEYYRQLYDLWPTDAKGIQDLRTRLDYTAVQRAFRMIEDDGWTVIVRSYGAIDSQARVGRWIEEIREDTKSLRTLMRRLQPFTVGVPTYQAERYVREGLIDLLIPESTLGVWKGRYDPIRGLVADVLPEEPWVV